MRDYNIRRPMDSDIPEFERIAANYGNNPLVDRFETSAVVQSGPDIKGFGVTRTLIEAVLYCDGSVRDRAATLELLLGQAINDSRSRKFNQLYVFVEDNPKFETILTERYGFKKAKGTCLLLEF